MTRTIAVLLLLSPAISYAGSDDGRFDIYWIDVEGGASTLIVTPTNESILIDAVTHHGLDASNNPVVLETIKPRVAIMNNGPTKGCLPEVFANLQDTKSLQAIYQVHKNLRPDGSVNNVADEFIANHKAADECEGNVIKLSVAPDSKSYTVSIPANGHEMTYQTKR
jgi:hypothetical protein